MLIEFGDDTADQSWDCDADVSDINDPSRIPDETRLNLPIPPGAPKNTRREQLKEYICESYVRRFNFRRRRSSDDSASGDDNSADEYITALIFYM